MAFVFDYAELGRQTAGLIIDALNKKKFGAQTPVFKVWLNESVLQKLEMKMPENLQAPVVAGP
jgi:ABC-type uncharacterized transport system substrate-binding protein